MSETTPASATATEPTITERDMLGAMEVLSTAGPEPDRLLILTDEEIQALEGASALAIPGGPYLAQGAVDAASAAATALRSLVARGMARTEDRENEGEVVTGQGDPARRPVQLERRLAGVLALRHIPEAMVTTERTLNGGTTTLAHYLFPEAGVLEEYVTVDGFHHFCVPTLGAVPGRLQRFVDPFEVAAADEEPQTLPLHEARDAFEDDDTRSVSVISVVTDGASRRATVATTSSAVRVLDNGPLDSAPDPQAAVQMSAVSAETLLSLISVLIPRPADSEDSQPEAQR